MDFCDVLFFLVFLRQGVGEDDGAHAGQDFCCLFSADLRLLVAAIPICLLFPVAGQHTPHGRGEQAAIITLLAKLYTPYRANDKQTTTLGPNDGSEAKQGRPYDPAPHSHPLQNKS